ncbi:MAG: uracil-DNA glycosylase [Bacteroidetes bacterium]|nr:uracil-DNA glycosylase [Bacteroidota bacterium]
MPDVLAELRAALAFQRELGGRYVPRVEVPEDEGPRRATAPEPTAVLPVPSDTPDEPMPTIDMFGGDAPAPEPSLPASPYARLDALIPDGHPVKACTTLAEVEAVAQNTVFIPLDETRINPVFGVGRPDADLMIVGEAPGADEDRTGEPFVGRAGQLLTKILAAIGLERDDVYIANILKSRPPGNRDPEPDEIAAHLPMLYKQMVLVRPKVILCVGKTSGNALLGKRAALGSLRDREHDFHGLPLFVTYHPAALLRNEQWKRPTWEDVQLMKAALDRETGG